MAIATAQFTISIINDGIGVQSSIIEYSVSSSGTTPPGNIITDGSGNPIMSNDGKPLTDGSWSATLPSVPNGNYLWTRTRFVLSDGSFDMIYNVSYYAEDGSDGVSVARVVPEFRLSDSSSSMTGSGTGYTWSITKPEIGAGQYIWERQRTELSNGTIVYSDAVCDVTISGILFDVDRNSNAITQKIWQSDIDNSISSYDSSTTQSIRDRVTRTESDIDGITSTVSDMESTLDTKADNTTVTTLLNTVSENEQTASQFRQTVTSTYAKLTDVDNKIGNIKIGGNNLYLITKQEAGYLHYSGSGAISAQSAANEYTSDYISVKEGENYVIQSWVTPITSGESWLAYELFNANDRDLVDENGNTLINEKNETLTILYMTPVGSRVDKYGKTVDSGVEITADGQERLMYSIEIPEGVNRLRVSYRSYEDGMCMIEKATTPSEYAMNPRDIEGYADAIVANTKTEIKQTTDSISLEVSKKVGTNEIISKINQSPENITISASKVNLEGQVSFDMLDNDAQTTINNISGNAKTALIASKAYTGTCSTAAGTAEKVVTCTDTDFDLVNGVIIKITFTTASTADAPTLNVNSKGVKNIYFDRAVVSSSNRFRWQAGSVVTFQYNGANWVVLNYENLEYFTSSTAAGTAAKVNATAAGTFVLCNGATINMYFSTANSADAPTLNIGGTGAFAIYYKNAVTSSTNKYLWDAGATLTFTYSGSYWYVNDGGSALVKAYAKTSVDWVGTNGQGVLTAKSIINNWATDATSATTTIKGGLIQTHTITADQLATDAIMSSNFIAGGTGSPFSGLGTFLDLATGNIYMPNFGVDAQTGAAFFNGTIIADSGSIGSDDTNYWNIGTFTDYDGNDSAGIIGMGTSYIQSGKWMISQDRIDTRWYDNQRKYTYSTKDEKYWDYGMHAPDLSSNNDYDKIFLYVRKSAGNTIPVLESGWDYSFKVDSDGNVYANSLIITGDGSGDTFLPRTGGTITGNLTVNGTLTATASKANQVANSLSINGKSYNGSVGVTVGTIGAAYGGTGQTSLVNSANALINALTTSSDIPIDADYFISQYVNGGTSTTTYHRRPMSKIWTYIKNKLDSTYNFDNYRLLTNNDFDTANITNANIGNLVVTGSGRFTNGLYGNLTGNVIGDLAGTATYATIVKDSGNNTKDITFAYSKSGLVSKWSTTPWFAAWNGYELRAITGTNVRTTIDAMYSPKITSADAADSFMDEGFYRIAFGHSSDETGTWPTNNYGDLLVSNHGTAYQIYIPDANMKIFKRVYNNTNEEWNEWSDEWDITATSAKTAIKATQDGNGNNIASTYLKLSGGTITGDLVIQKTTTISNNAPARIYLRTVQSDNNITTAGVIAAYDDHDKAGSGVNMVLNPAGNIFIGGGESAQSLYNTIGQNSTSENAYLTADNYVYIESNSQTIANRLGMVLNSSHELLPIKAETYTNNVGSIGNSSYKWANIYATTFHGNLDSRTITIGDTGKSVNWSQDVSWTKAEISGDATTSASGWMSADDKSKLDSITVTSGGSIVLDSITGSNGISVTTDSNTGVTSVKHANSAITAGTASGTSSTSNLAFGATVSLPSITYDAYGHITSKGTTSFKLPTAPTTITGNAGTATKLQSAQNISVGNLTEGFDGSAAISFPTADMGIIWSDINPIKTKTYTGIIVEGNSDPAGWIYFFKAPSTGGYYDQWHITYKVTASMAGQNDGKQTSIVHVNGIRNTYMSYYTWNNINNTSYRPIYGHPFYPATDAGRTSKYGPIFGIRLHSSYEPTNSTYARTITFEILQEDGCEVTFFDSPVLYADVPGTGSTNFGGRVSFDGTTQGRTESGDRNSTDRGCHYYTHLTAGSGGMMAYSLVMEDENGTWQSFTTTSGTGTSKARNTVGFKLGRMYYMNMSGNVASGNANGNGVVYSYIPAISITYSINSGATLHANKPLWIVGTMNNGLFYLDTTWWTQTPPTSADGKVYIPLGVVYNSTVTSTTASAIDFLGWQGAYYHDGTHFLPYGAGADKLSGPNLTPNRFLIANGTAGSYVSSQMSYLNNEDVTVESTTVKQNGLLIWGATYGNTATQLVSQERGVLSYGDGGPQIIFRAGSNSTSAQSGSLLFTDHDGCGTGVSWHFVSNQTDWNVNSKRFVAKTSVTIGENIPNTSYNLHVAGTANITGTTTGSYFISSSKMTITNAKISQISAARGGLFSDGVAFSNPAIRNDQAWVRVLGTGESDTILEIATGDDGGAGEQIKARQYNTSNTVVHEMTLLDTSGHTAVSGNLTIGSSITDAENTVKLVMNTTLNCLDFVFN